MRSKWRDEIFFVLLVVVVSVMIFSGVVQILAKVQDMTDTPRCCPCVEVEER